MKTIIVLAAAVLLMAGCASFEEAYYIDREFGQAHLMAFENQILYPDPPNRNKLPEGHEGIDAEEIMDIHNQSFGEEVEDIDVFQFSLEQ